jgi:RimJ/RimL family protein N-acetyltransferase
MQLSDLMRGEKVYLAAWTKDDVSTVAQWYANTEFSRMLDTDPARPRTEKYPEEWMDEAEKSGKHFSFAVKTCAEDKLIGFVELEGILWQHGVAWLAVGIGEPEYWGEGYGREACALILRFGFWEVNLHRIQLTVFAYNTRGIAAYEKLGFVREGVFREFLQRDGRRYDMYLYGLLRYEWEARLRSEPL